MGTGFSDASLALFTTLAPMGAGAFLTIAISFLVFKFDTDVLSRIDKMSLIAVGFLVIGFIAAFFHLANPVHAFSVFTGIGSSPLSNEIAVGCVFATVAVLFAVLANFGKLSVKARKGFSVALVVLALVFFAFCGLAYMVPTIPTWNGPSTIIQMVGYGLLAGSALASFVLGCAKVSVDDKLRNLVILVGAIGFAVSVIGLVIQNIAAASISNIWGTAIELVPLIWVVFAIYVVCAVASFVLIYVSAKKNFAITFTGLAVVLMLIGVFMARIGFYGLYMGIAL